VGTGLCIGCVGDDDGEAAQVHVGDIGVVGLADIYNKTKPDVKMKVEKSAGAGMAMVK
jgi:hypothetical protein